MRRLGLPEGLFADCAEKLVAAWRARAIKMYPSDFRDTAEDVRITLLAALLPARGCRRRQGRGRAHPVRAVRPGRAVRRDPPP
ncbi:putative transposase [Streptomyces albus]|uniref:Putative transposase n=1 Tax=Streptomyces albus (strain ATCC 21838 / DSM 41398 / FERM P-419 / JCM 4703 / NBRC 107858) TaxID=1081613 RepID=A0A0B5EZ59_STRA4|nr:putative transposase [Streptomyces albus]AOU81394.1 putative transposase [Streptomyces albus]AYN37087.1 putative transposase [Streptomyces albus]